MRAQPEGKPALQSGLTSNQSRWTAVDEKLGELLIPADPALEGIQARALAVGLPDHGISANQGQLLGLLVRAQGARRVLEIGTFAGYSTIWLARTLPFGGRVLTLEIDPG